MAVNSAEFACKDFGARTSVTIRHRGPGAWPGWARIAGRLQSKGSVIGPPAAAPALAIVVGAVAVALVVAGSVGDCWSGDRRSVGCRSSAGSDQGCFIGCGSRRDIVGDGGGRAGCVCGGRCGSGSRKVGADSGSAALVVTETVTLVAAIADEPLVPTMEVVILVTTVVVTMLVTLVVMILVTAVLVAVSSGEARGGFVGADRGCGDFRAGENELIRTEDNFAAHHGQEHLGIGNVVHGAIQNVGINHDEIGIFARLDGAFLFLFKIQPGIVVSVEADGLFARELLIGIDDGALFGFAGHRDPDAEPGVPGIQRIDRVQTRAVVASRSHNQALVKPAS